MERGSIQIQIYEDAHRHDILPGFPYLLEKKEEKKKFYYLGSCGADAIREAVTLGGREGGMELSYFFFKAQWPKH